MSFEHKSIPFGPKWLDSFRDFIGTGHGPVSKKLAVKEIYNYLMAKCTLVGSPVVYRSVRWLRSIMI